MAKSALATGYYPADPSNYSPARYRARISEITLHHMAGVLSAAQCGAIFQRPGRNGSAHYGIGVDGEIANYVDEDCVAWANSNWSSNCRAITIENSNSSTGGDWPIGDKTLDSLIKLVADIAKRYNLGALIPGQNLTWHNMYTAHTACPGPYLRSKVDYIAEKANEINSSAPAPAPAPAAPGIGINVGDKVVPKAFVDYYGTRLLKTRDYYFVAQINAKRAVLKADSMDGAIYCAMNVDNLNKVGDPAPAKPATIGVGSKVTLTTYVDWVGNGLLKTRDFYFVSELNGKRAVLRADSMNGAIYAAVNIDNLRIV